jgi:hypothetical protein
MYIMNNISKRLVNDKECYNRLYKTVKSDKEQK